VVFFHFAQDGADDGFAEKLRAVGNFVLGAEMLDYFVFGVVKRQGFMMPPRTASGGLPVGIFWGLFHKQISLMLQSKEKKLYFCKK
jgi:hypothetical protein